MLTSTIHTPRKKSEPLTKGELKKLKGYRKRFSTDVACASTIGIDRNVLGRVILAGSGSPETVEKIRTVLSS